MNASLLSVMRRSTAALRGGGGSELNRRVAQLALPALGALLVEPLYNLTDTGIVGHLGTIPLGALAVATGILNVVWWTIGFLRATTVTRVAWAVGAGDTGGAGRKVGAAYVLAMALGVAGVIGILTLASPLTTVMGARGPIAESSALYLRISALGVVPLAFTLAGTGHLNGLGRTRRPFEITLASNLLNVALEIALVYGAHLGIAGSAWGTVIAQFAAAAGFLVSSWRAQVRPARPQGRDLRLLSVDGIPLTLRTLALDAALLGATAVAAHLTPTVLAAQQIALQVFVLLALGQDALAVAAQILTGEAMGRADRERARLAGRHLIRLAVVGGATLGALLALVASPLAGLFSPVPAVANTATHALYVCAAQQPVAALAFVLDGLVLGVGDYRGLSQSTLVALALFAPLAVLLLLHPSFGIVGLWLALTVWVAGRAAMLLRRWRAALGPSGTTAGPRTPPASPQLLVRPTAFQ